MMQHTNSSLDHLAPPGSSRHDHDEDQHNDHRNDRLPGKSSSDKSNSKRMATVASQWAGTLLQSTKHTVQSWTARKYTLPDKHVASQVLMYRQLLHTKCRPNLTLSRDYQGTPAQQAVLDMPWWSQGILQSRKMVISYQNLVARLWIAGALTPHGETWHLYYQRPPPTSPPTSPPLTTTTSDVDTTAATKNGPGTVTANPATTATTKEEKKNVEQADQKQPPTQPHDAAAITNTTTTTIPADLANMTPEQAKFRAPVPHRHWVDRLGFQQEDPVTDFRSGGVLSLAMMVHLVESCPETFGRFTKADSVNGRPAGDASVFPFALTCINITDMMAKFLMLSKTVDRMDALLSQKPFWRMFADPHALLVCQETAMQVTANVVVELGIQRPHKPVTVFDFATVLAIVERRMEYDYLMAGPTTIAELRSLHVRNQQRYQQQLQQRLRLRQEQQRQQQEEDKKKRMMMTNQPTTTTSPITNDPLQHSSQNEGESAFGTAMGDVDPIVQAFGLPFASTVASQPQRNAGGGGGDGPVPISPSSPPRPPPSSSPKASTLQAGVQVWKHRAASVAGNVWQKVKAPVVGQVNPDDNQQGQYHLPNNNTPTTTAATRTGTTADPTNNDDRDDDDNNNNLAGHLGGGQDMLDTTAALVVLPTNDGKNNNNNNKDTTHGNEPSATWDSQFGIGDDDDEEYDAVDVQL